MISDGVLAEVKRGNPVSELDALRHLSANVIVRGDKVATDGAFTPRFLTEVEFDLAASRLPIEMFLINLFRIMTGRPSDRPLNDQFRDALEWQVDQMRRFIEGLEPSTVRDNADALATKFSASDVDLGVEPNFRIDDKEMRNLRLGTDHLSSISAPDVVQKILQRLPESFREALNQFFCPIVDVTTIRDRVQVAGVLLVILGFSRDKRIRKTAENASLKGAISQWSDLEHIASACGCSMFLTADRDCARLAYALYEHFAVNTISAFLDRSKPDGEIRAVGPNFWP